MYCFSRNVIHKLIFVYILCLGQACSKEAIRKNKKISSLIDSKNSGTKKKSIEVIEISSAASFGTPLQACPTKPYNIPQNLNNIIKDRIPELEQAKIQLLKEIHQDGLTNERAINLALVNNPDLFAYYENLQIGFADLVEAGLRQNPIITKNIRYPNEEGQKINKLFEIAFNYLDFFLIPFKQRAAEAELKMIEAEVQKKVLDLVEEVQINWLMVKTLELELNQEEKKVELKKLAAEISLLQRKAGNINSLRTQEKEIEYEEAKEKLKIFIAELEIAKEKLNQSLGLFGPQTCWQIHGEINLENDSLLNDIYNLEQIAILNRPDIESIRREIYAIAQKAKLKEPWTYADLWVGISKEREPEGFTVAGPQIELTNPVFNYGQGEKIKYDALLAQAQEKLLSKVIQASSEIREFVKTANIYQSQLEDLEIKILPDFKKQIDDAQAQYNVMALGVYELFDLKEKEIESTIEHTKALRNLMKAKIQLLHALGGSFDILRRSQ